MINNEIQPTEENLLNTLKDDFLKRNKDLLHFYNLLCSVDDAFSISIDGRWGSGKTFFIKQTIMLINACNEYTALPSEKRECIKRAVFKEASQDETETSMLGIYYDAWENDNDIDPVFSIIYEITKQLSVTCNLNEVSIAELAAATLEAISGRNVSNIINALKSKDPLTQFKKEKDLEGKIKSFLGSVLEERANRLVIFIDELDRCKPSYAVQLLERTKHLLNDDRITFVFAINAEELQHTVKHFYGDGFDACRYMDRFFDLRIVLPPAKTEQFYLHVGMDTGSTLGLVCRKIISMYNFELREASRFYQQVWMAVHKPLNSSEYRYGFSEEKGKLLILIYVVPLIIGLRMSDISLHDSFINGENSTPLVELLGGEEDRLFHLERLLKNNETFNEEQDKTIVTRKEVIERLYEAIFLTNYGYGTAYSTELGHYEFSASSKDYALQAASMLSYQAEYGSGD